MVALEGAAVLDADRRTVALDPYDAVLAQGPFAGVVRTSGRAAVVRFR